MQTDNQLIRRIKKKQDKKAADELIQRYYREIYAFTYRQTGERELALDLTQEIFITVLQGIYAFDEKKAGFRTWAYRVAANRITDYYRSKSYKKEKLQQPLQWETEEEKTVRDLAEHMVQKEEIRRIMDIVVSYEREWIRIFQKKCFSFLRCLVPKKSPFPRRLKKSLSSVPSSFEKTILLSRMRSTRRAVLHTVLWTY